MNPGRESVLRRWRQEQVKNKIKLIPATTSQRLVGNGTPAEKMMPARKASESQKSGMTSRWHWKS